MTGTGRRHYALPLPIEVILRYTTGVSLKGIPAIPMTMAGAVNGPMATRPIGLAQSTTKKLCLCNLQRQKDAERAAAAKKPQRGY